MARLSRIVIPNQPVHIMHRGNNYVVQSSRQQCTSTGCITNTGIITIATSGSLTGTVVPIPAAAWLFGSGLLTLLGARNIYPRKLKA